MAKPLDITGKQYKRLTAIRYDHSEGGHRYWLCKCECGNTIFARLSHLQAGNISSCGCLQKDSAREKHTTHGMKNTPIYRTWNSMKNRCNLSNRPSSKYYYDRGIKYCESWEKFENFYNDMHETYFQGAFIDRIDNDLGYSKDNCRWVTRAESNKNRRCVKNKS